MVEKIGSRDKLAWWVCISVQEKPLEPGVFGKVIVAKNFGPYSTFKEASKASIKHWDNYEYRYSDKRVRCQILPKKNAKLLKNEDDWVK